VSTRILVPSGVLGLGFNEQALARGVAMQPNIICIDGGSTDSGPFYLGTGTSKYARAACKAEWRLLMQARAAAGVPLVIGSCGTCGTDSMVDWMLDITREIAAELDQKLTVATLYSEQSTATVQQALASDQVTALDAAPTIDARAVSQCTHIVALAGAEQVNACLATGADIILAGRTTDTAIICALALARGEHAGAAWHAAKIAECGALCSTNPTSGVILVDIDQSGFDVQALADDAMCTPHSVSAHMLYENADPYILHEPGGHLDVTNACYTALDEKRVRVTGSAWVPAEHYAIKLEGARVAGYQTTIMALLRDAHYVANAEQWSRQLHTFLTREIQTRMDLDSSEYDLEFRLIGIDAVLGELENRRSELTEVGVLGIITAATAEHAEEIGKLINPFVLHYPLTTDEELPTFAFPYSPAQSERGALYEFCLHHVMTIDNPMDAFRMHVHQLP